VHDPTNFPKDDTWESLLQTPNHPEYMAGHAATSAAVIEALRLLHGGDTIPAVTIMGMSMMGMSMMGGGRTFTSLTAMANEIARSRVLAGAHFSFSTKAGQTMGRQVGANTVKVLGVGGCGAGNYAWGSACLPCQMDTYWPSKTFTDSCMPCITGFTSPMGASACEPRLIVALRANGREFAGEASEDDGMMMPMMSADSVSTAAARSGTTKLKRRGPGVIQLVQRNPQSAPSGALAVVTLTLPKGVKFAGKSQATKTNNKQVQNLKRPKVDGQTLTWQFAPLAAGEENIFTIKVRVTATVKSWLTFRASTYYLTSASAEGMSGMDGGMDGGMPSIYGLTGLSFNVPIN
jgi:hypothetical protein